MLPALLIIAAAFFKAVADICKFKFYESVFHWYDPRFWDGDISWKYAPYLKWTKYPMDAWHIANSLMIVCMVLAVVFHTPLLKWYYEVAIGGILWNLTFNIFYDKILKR